ncbi:zinc ribbon domain-containing protein [Desulfonema ishimotonii]|uniref:Zinc ribbon domain-containing protein n=1 Tax=Desulfonema ishimotonii TaxID=45657 RepID=A0A401G3C2_9BACT|nr:zinc ribbon domain-containing protein [Desulfonema ishimotonii]GBC63742.1 zinc ribbon domain-containing protein [Desulfonema ishimotonii]
MPIYEYECQKCGHRFERLMLSCDDPAPECPECHAPDVQKQMSSGAVRPHGIPKGSGGFTPPSKPCESGGG